MCILLRNIAARLLRRLSWELERAVTALWSLTKSTESLAAASSQYLQILLFTSTQSSFHSFPVAALNVCRPS